jgi:hypothetical protein
VATAVVSVLAAGTPSRAVEANVATGPRAGGYRVDPPSPPETELISYPDFTAVDALSINGTATIARGAAPARRPVLRLTNGGFRQAGSAWSTTQIDSHRSFTTTFDVSLHYGSRGADGFAFVLQTAGPRALGGSGGGLGYRGRTPSVAVEFDIFRNPDDPDGNHVAVVKNGHPEAHLAAAAAPFRLFRTPFRAIVSYDASSHTLNVWVRPLSGTATASPLIRQSIDIGAVLGADSAYVGFTGSTGDLTAVQDILSWSVSAPAA